MLVCAWRTAAADDDYPREWVEMNPVLSRLEGFAFLVIFGLSMVALTAWVGRGHQKNRAEFLVAGRSLGVWLAALSIAASWIWAPALFVASQKAYDQGLPGVFWFTFPNVLSFGAICATGLQNSEALSGRIHAATAYAAPPRLGGPRAVPDSVSWPSGLLFRGPDTGRCGSDSVSSQDCVLRWWPSFWSLPR